MDEKKQAFATRFSGWNMDPEDVIIVGVDEEPNEATRHLLDKASNSEPVDEATILNMMVYGCVEPVIVTKIGPDPYMVDGRGRGRALREANKRLVNEGKEPYLLPAVKSQGEEHKLFGVMVSANGFRREDDQLTKAEKVQQFLDLGRDHDQAAATFGVSVTSIKNWLVLLDLAAPVKKMVKNGKLSPHAASKLAGFPAEKQIEKANAAIAKAKETGGKPTGKTMTTSTSDKVVVPPKRVVQSVMAMETRPTITPEHDNFWSALLLMTGELSLEDVGLSDTVTQIIEAKVAAKAQKIAEVAERKAEAEKKKADAIDAKEKAEKEKDDAKAKVEKAKADAKAQVAKAKDAAKAKVDKAKADAKSTTTIAKRKNAPKTVAA